LKLWKFAGEDFKQQILATTKNKNLEKTFLAFFLFTNTWKVEQKKP